MSPHRFYLAETTLETGATVELRGAVGRQISRVLRMQPGDNITLFSCGGSEWSAEIVTADRSGVKVIVGARSEPETEPRLNVTICQSLVPQERMEYVVQKCTELGAAEIIPVITERVQSRDARPGDGKLDRWRRIAVEATEQSGRTRVPEICAPVSFNELLHDQRIPRPLIVLWEEEQGKSLREIVRESLNSNPKQVSVLIGPVGGLSVAEADAASSAGALIAGAGSRILRAETAPVVALTALMYEAGELAARGGRG